MVVALFGLSGCGLPVPAGPPAARRRRARARALHGHGAVHQRRRPRAEQQRARQRRPRRRRPRRSRSRPDGWTAQVTVEVNGAVVLPANATARLRQTSLLGEKFVELMPSPTDPPQGRLAAGAVIPADRTDVGAQVEEVLGALSLLLNGGGVEKVQTIARELNAATHGQRGPAAVPADQPRPVRRHARPAEGRHRAGDRLPRAAQPHAGRPAGADRQRHRQPRPGPRRAQPAARPARAARCSR